nr:hypothetical protein [Priestia koreensis]
MSENYTSREERRKKSTEGKGKQKPSGSGKPNKKKRGGIFRKIIVAILLLGIIGVIAGAATFFAMISDAPKIDDSMLKDPLSSKIYDKNMATKLQNLELIDVHMRIMMKFLNL